MKKCKHCGEDKLLNCFWKDISKKDGLLIYCIDCGKLKGKQSRVINGENIRSRTRIKYKQNRKYLINKNYQYRKNRDNGLFLKFLSIKQRCNHKGNQRYKDYGGRGIKCEWETYQGFKTDMYKSYIKYFKKDGSFNTTIERIDNNGNYC
ncbi:MAG: hypothetical protein IT215_00100, partial [Chitinophagaceae bacterium]|nr:hypothetical protein [Chitinophagaceae bacterium]